MFEPVPTPRSSVDNCADALRSAILDGRLAPGDRLPPERTLATQFGVNRLTLRAALAKLITQGLVAARQGSGYRVLDFRRSGGPELIAGLAGSGDSAAFHRVVTDVLRVRRHLARALLEHLAEAEEPMDPTPITAAVDAFAEAVARGASTAALAVVDLDVIAALVDAAASPVFALCLNPLSQVLHALPTLRDAVYRDPASNVAGYRVLIQWLGAGAMGDPGIIIEVLRDRDQDTLRRLEVP